MDEALRENLSICYNSSKSLIFIVNDLLDLTRYLNEASFPEEIF